MKESEGDVPKQITHATRLEARLPEVRGQPPSPEGFGAPRRSEISGQRLETGQGDQNRGSWTED